MLPRMASVERAVALAPDSKGRVISIFVGAVLLPSVALSVLSFHAVPKHAENVKITLYKQADSVLYYVEKDLQLKARKKALEAARLVGPELLVDGRPEVVRKALVGAGLDPDLFETLRVEGSSPVLKLKAALGAPHDDLRDMREALKGFESPSGPEDSVPINGEEGHRAGILHYAFGCGYVHRQLVATISRASS